MRTSRAELNALLGPAPTDQHDRELPTEFPRSRIVRAVLRGQAKTGLTLLAVAGLALNPVLAAKILRKVPLELLATRILGLSK
jgi:hypothetical protein